MTLRKIPDVGTIVLFEGHEYRVTGHRNGTSELRRLKPGHGFKSVRCTSADLTPTVEGEYMTMLEHDADNFVNRTPPNTAERGLAVGYASTLLRRAKAQKFETDHPFVLPFRHMIRTRDWAVNQEREG